MQKTDTIRSSKQKTAILHILEGTKSHPSAEWVYTKVRDIIPNISLGTVYRNLSKLAAQGIIQRMEIGDGTDRFDYTISPHYHFHCECCGSLLDADLPYNHGLNSEDSLSSLGEISGHSIIFHGRCKNCINK